MSKHYGKCALCGRECNLTFEHIPPRAAFNSAPAKPVSGNKILTNDDRMPWDITGLQYDNQQQGMGRYTLCAECNNNTGTWYGNSYIELAYSVHDIISNPIPDKNQGFGIKDIYPLRFIKQVLSMFCSINNIGDPRINPLREFVLDKNATGLDHKKYKLCMYFTKGNLMKYAPLSALLKMNDFGFESLALSEITAYPLGFVLYFDPTSTWGYDGIDITKFADWKYDDIADVVFPICIKEVNDFLPTYYRSKEEIAECIANNRLKAEEQNE